MEPHKKIYKIHWGFWQPPINDTHTTTNQKQAYVMDGGMDERRKWRESMGGIIHCFGGDRVGRVIKN
jgi:hypothetical protein